ncbi:hypothetical protein BC629DRAFT_1510195 [Irpex lacteus]|nr:hypothetical protein BC629DRAFT_1510195 [Irpex lacteus]
MSRGGGLLLDSILSLTAAILTKILLVYRTSFHRSHYRVALVAITESALVAWIALVLLEIASLAPTKGHISDDLNFGYILDCIIPIFFGISQCLITVRVAFADDYYNRDRTPTVQLASCIQFAKNDAKGHTQYRRETSATSSAETISA